MLNKSLVFFLIGIVFGIAISGIEAFWESDHPEELLTFFIFSLTYGEFFVNMSYYLILIVILPFIAIPQLKKKLTPKALLLYSFVTGITFWGAIDGLYIILFL